MNNDYLSVKDVLESPYFVANYCIIFVLSLVGEAVVNRKIQVIRDQSQQQHTGTDITKRIESLSIWIASLSRLKFWLEFFFGAKVASYSVCFLHITFYIVSKALGA